MKYTLSDLRIDTGRQLVSRADDPIPLPKLSFDLLLALVRAAPNLVSLDELMRLVWPGVVVSPETVSQRVKLLRDALGDAPRAPRYIAGLRGRGYQVVAAVQEIGDTSKSSDAHPSDMGDKRDRDKFSSRGSLGTTTTNDRVLHTDASDSDSESEHSAPAIAAARITICVLPFANMSGDPGQEYFSDGITEDILTELSRWRLLAVRSRSASFQFRGIDLKQVARELNVRFIVEGSVRRMDSRIRVNVQLIDSETGSHVWAEKFDREAGQIFTVQDQVVQTIVSTLVGQVHVSDVERARRKPSSSLEAYECVLEGNALPWDDPKGLADATRLFKKAIDIDPSYGHAHALLAAVLCSEWQDDLGGSDIALQEALVLARRAVELDEKESTCSAMLGWICLLRRTFDLAVQYTGRAVAMNPNNQWNAADMGSILLYVGQAEESLVWFKRAKEIDPYFNEPWYWRSIGIAHMILHRYQEALAVFDYLSARNYRVAAYMAACHARLGEIESAAGSAAECLAMKPDFCVAHFMSKHPFKYPTDAASLAESMLMAGLPGSEIPRMSGMHSKNADMEPTWVGEVIHFWFEDLGEANWFARRDGIDSRIRDRFLTLHGQLVAQDGLDVIAPRPILAAVIVLDQFSRNLFRDSARAYSADPIARRLSRIAIERGFDIVMKTAERLFVYLPFEHSEDRQDQVLALRLIKTLGVEDWTRHTLEHKAVIDRFGRFPHRNVPLGRLSTAEEMAFLNG